MTDARTTTTATMTIGVPKDGEVLGLMGVGAGVFGNGAGEAFTIGEAVRKRFKKSHPAPAFIMSQLPTKMIYNQTSYKTNASLYF